MRMLSSLFLAVSLAFGTHIVDLALTIDEAARQSLQRDRDDDVPATLTSVADGRRYSVALHVKGQLGSARAVDDKPAFKIKLRNDERLLGLERLTLNNMVQDPSMLHEALGYQVYAAAGVLVPEAGYVHLAVNGQDYGLYLNLETIDSAFLEGRFGDKGGILYEAAYGVDLREGDESKFELHAGTDPGRARLIALIRSVQEPGDGVFYGASALVDTKGFLSMMAAGALLADWDNYYSSNNYRIYWSPSASRWFFIPTGIDQTFTADATTVFGASGVLFQKCLASERCTREYADTVREVAARFERLALPTKMDALLSMIGAAAQADPKRPYDEAAMRVARESMRAFIDTRPSQVRREVACLDSAPLIACAGAIVKGPEGCLERVSHGREKKDGPVHITRCTGAPRQRWRVLNDGTSVELEGQPLAIPPGSMVQRSIFR